MDVGALSALETRVFSDFFPNSVRQGLILLSGGRERALSRHTFTLAPKGVAVLAPT